MSGQNPWALQNFGRVDIKPEEFDRFIYQKGANVTWEKSILCSCINETTGQADFGCPACGGKGYYYFDPTSIRAAVTGITGDKNQIPIGLVDVGTSYMTTRAESLVGFRDRITFEDFTTAYSQILDYDVDGVKLKYPCMNLVALMILGEKVPENLITLSDDKQTLFIDQSYGLKQGERLSILYHIKPRYVVIDVPHELRGQFIKFGQPEEKWEILPRQFVIKREDLLPLQRGELI
ncbi:hypothetical protein M5_0078 [Lysinibacillus phage vB_LfM_LysYB2]|nr:hypothetical protein M5_0078 [Lysinibacillus phage vB_LfM_LysYB2]